MDYSLGFVGFVMSLPINVLAALAIKLETKGPILFRQLRIGKDGKPFVMYKFRTMYDDVSGDMSLIGPRPFTIYNHNECNCNHPDFVRRYVVKPGAKLAYNSLKSVDIGDTIRVERDYVENWSLKKDIKILFRIISDIFKGNNY